MRDLIANIIGSTFKNSSASHFESYDDNINILLKNNNHTDITVHFIDIHKSKEIIDLVKVKARECIKSKFDFESFKNKDIQIHINRMNQKNDLDILFIQIPKSGAVELFLHIN
jgi:hypothetical protein